MEKRKTPESVEAYISEYPSEIQKKLNDIRKVVRRNAPEAVEKISYGMPAYTFKGMLLYFAVHINHIGLYPYPSAIEAFRQETTQYQTSKGTIRFPLDKPLPLKLISEIVSFRVQENIIKEQHKKKTRNKRK
jgi:uncharacterized protein YdhG (YjbR/CyaY superfamily)